MPLVHHELCFGCGRANLFGLMLEIEETAAGSVAGRCFIKQDHQGADRGFAHEGVLAAALSEAMACGADARAVDLRLALGHRAPVGSFARGPWRIGSPSAPAHALARISVRIEEARSDGNDGADAIRGAGSPPREGGTSGPVRRSQRRPARLQEPRRPPDAASARAQAWPPLLAPGKRHQPLHPHGALRQASSDDGRRRLAHHPGGLPRDGRNRSGRARRGGRARGASIRDRLSRGRRGLPRRRATAPLGPGQGHRP